jgi:hypothetical protein
MKSLILTLPTLMLVAQAAFADTPQPPPHGGGPPIEQMAHDLNLDATSSGNRSGD